MRSTAALLLALLAGCSGETGPADVAVLRYDPETQAYGIGVERLETLEDLREMRGAAATAIGGARIELEPLRSRLELLDEGGAVAAQFVEQDGAMWPLDFHSFSLATTYRNLERARAYARARGLGGELDGIRFFYFPDVTVVGQDGSFADNAAYVPLLGSFILPPFARLQEIPLSMNTGVIAHEYGHAIFTALVHQGDPSPDHVARWCPGNLCSEPTAWVLMYVVEEGFADAWALGVVRDVRFLERSIRNHVSRRVEPFDRAKHCTSDGELRDEIARESGLDPTYWSVRQYELGTVLAAALWRAGQDPGTSHDRVMDALLASYRPLGELVRADPDGGEFGSYATIAATVAAAAPDEATRRAICATFRDRLGIGASRAGACADVVALEECR